MEMGLYCIAQITEGKDFEMALRISDDCSACDACVDACPNNAISAANPYYIIDPLRCTECVGVEDEPQCKLVCSVECIDENPSYPETKEQLRMKYQALQA